MGKYICPCTETDFTLNWHARVEPPNKIFIKFRLRCTACNQDLVIDPSESEAELLGDNAKQVRIMIRGTARG